MKLNEIMSWDYSKNKKQVILTAIASCLICFLFAFLPYFIRGNTFVWDIDGKEQHLLFLDYIKQSGSLSNIGKFDLNLGFGEDYLFYFAYYMLFDPFNILFYVFPFLNVSITYSLIVVLKFFTIFTVMFLYLKHKKLNPIYAILGACCYMVIGTSLFSVPRHPQFATGLIFFPLIVWGLENVLEHKKPYLLIASVSICILSNYYQFYICAMCGAIYAILYYFVLHPIKTEKFNFKKFALTFLKIFAYCLTGILICSFMLIPIMLNTIHAPRSSSKGFSIFTGINLQHFAGILKTMITNYMSPNYTTLGLNIFILLCLCIFISTYKGRNSLIFWFFTAMLFVPFFGFATNVFNYYSGRWYFVYAFICIVCAVMGISKIDSIQNTQKAHTIKLFFTFLMLCLFAGLNYYIGQLSLKINTIIAIIIMLSLSILSILLTILFYKKVKVNIKLSNKILNKNFIIPAVFITSMIMALWFNVEYSAMFIKTSDYNAIIDVAEQYVGKQNSGQIYRLDRGAMLYTGGVNNSNLLNGNLSALSYNSNSNGCINDFLTKNKLTNHINTLGSNGMESRVALEAITNVNYYKSVDQNIPYGFTAVEGFSNLYYNQNALPFGTFYTNSISTKAVNNLPGYELSNLMLEALIIDNNETDYNYTPVMELPNTTINCKNCEIKNNKIIVKNKANISITVTNCANKEVYLTFDKLSYNFNNRSIMEKAVNTPSRKRITAYTDSRKLNYYIYPEGQQMYTGSTYDYIINLGYYTEDELNITLTLSPGEYNFKNMQVVSYDMSTYQRNVDKLKQGAKFELKNFANYDGKHLSGTITNNENGYLFLTIPYSNSWSAKVDGKPANLYKANYGFMALKLDNGTHSIELSYKSPGLNIGIIFTLSGIVALGAIIITDIAIKQHRKRKLVK